MPAKTTPAREHDDRKRAYLKQSDVPSCSLSNALKVATAIAEAYGSKPTTPLKVAKALNLQPRARSFRDAAGASIAYGLTTGGYNAETISIAPTGLRILKPKKEGDDLAAKREAFLKPRVIKEFLVQYDTSPLPRDDIARNVLEEMGVPKQELQHVHSFIVEGAKDLGLVEDIKGKLYVSLQGAAVVQSDPQGDEAGDETPTPSAAPAEPPPPAETPTPSKPEKPHLTQSQAASRRVFITHGKNKAFIDPIKKLLGFGELEPIISAERQSVSEPVPDKVMNDMRACGAAIIHVEDEMHLVDKSANEHVVLNPNVLIEIGAAMALYGRRFILIVKEGVKLPSNLQGLYEVRYSGDTLDGDATIRLLEAINVMKSHPGPERYLTGQA